MGLQSGCVQAVLIIIHDVSTTLFAQPCFQRPLSTAMSTEDVIKSNAKYHAHLMQSIGSLDYVPSTLQAQQQYLKDLQSQLQSTRAQITALAKDTKKERKEHERIRDSTTKKLAYRLSGKKDVLASKIEKEERCAPCNFAIFKLDRIHVVNSWKHWIRS